MSMIAATTSSSFLASMKSVMPNFSARGRLPGLTSTPMIRFAPTMRAPWITLRPMPPRPNTATFDPGSTLAVFITAPRPVVTPQPM